MDPELTSMECKGHNRLITTPIEPLPCLLGVPLLILPVPHPLLGRIHLNTILNLLLICFTLMSNNNLSGMHLNRRGGPNTTLLPVFCHHLLLLQDNPRCLLNRTQTPTIYRSNRYTLERRHALPMLWRFRRSTYGLERSFQIANLLP